MTPEPRHSPIVPSYGAATLADLSSSILASLDPEAPESQNVLGLTPARRACLLIVDGLGWELLRDHPAAAPFLSELALNSRPITAGFPSTTVTSLGSIGTGRPPGQHGMLGYQVVIPGENRLLNGLRWDSRIDPRQWQPLPTIYERAAAAGIAAVHVAQGAFRGTGLTVATMRGADFRPADSMGALAAQAAAALWENGRGLVTVYHGDLDDTGHVFGVGSDAWYNQLAHVDKLAEQLASALPSGTCMYVTADHGMVDVGPEDKFDVDAAPELRAGLALLGGEPRARHLYARRGAAADVLATWREVLGDRAWVLSRDEAIKEGWFGPVDPAMADRIGDVVAAPAGSMAIVATKAEPRESALFGMHGSLTPRAAGARAHLHGHMNPRTDRDRLLVSVGALAAELARSPAPVLLDVRWRLGGPPGIDSYRRGHLPGAVFADLDRDLAGPPGPAGRHPLPDPAAFQAAMRAAGVSQDRPVVVYDDGDATVAARGWWTLRYFGHQDVRVLDGGYRAWAALPQELRGHHGRARAGPRRLHRGARSPAGARRGGRAGAARTGLLLDARAGERYRGETEPVDPVAGHIPGAVSAPTAGNVNPDGTFRDAAELAARFAALGAVPGVGTPGGAPVGAYCGSGVTAAHEVLALTLAGIPAALYVGSWSNWIADPARPVATGA